MDDSRKCLVSTLQYIKSINMLAACHHLLSVKILDDEISVSKRDRERIVMGEFTDRYQVFSQVWNNKNII